MKNFFIIFLIISFLILPHFNAKALIIDHNAVSQFDQIPDQYITAIKNNIRLTYGHSSHGAQIITGINWVRDVLNSSRYSYNYCGWVSSCPTPPSGELSVWTRVGHMQDAHDLGNPDYVRWMQATRDHLNNEGRDRNMVMWSWCGQLSYHNGWDVNEYLEGMNQLERDYPNVRFIYMTGHTNGCSPDDCPAWNHIHERNDAIRDYCRDNDRILYDFADIESWDPDGVYYPHTADDCDWCVGWCGNNQSECQILPGPSTGGYGGCAHSPDSGTPNDPRSYNCVLKGKAFWTLMARAMGWNPGTNPTCTDNDNDGYYLESSCAGTRDCNDNNPNIHPGANEICGNQIDEDCNGSDFVCTCTDGTEYDSCSTNKPKYCSRGALVDMASVCGCSDGYVIDGDNCILIQNTCSDETQYGECSSNRPLFCSDGLLIDRCSVCGCTDNQTCQTDGSCIGSGDINQDGIVDLQDMGIMMSDWNSNRERSDLNNDGIVDSEDYYFLYINWN